MRQMFRVRIAIDWLCVGKKKGEVEFISLGNCRADC